MEEVDKLVADYVAKHFPPNSSFPLFLPCPCLQLTSPLLAAPALLAGNSVHADRAFINKDLPQLASKLHYRILDVSSLKEIGRRWYPSLGWASKKDEAEHRALSDIKASIAGAFEAAFSSETTARLTFPLSRRAQVLPV
jgi:oligoribonuclease